MATYARTVSKAFIVKPSKAKEFINHSSKKDIDKIYSIADMYENIFGKKRTEE